MNLRIYEFKNSGFTLIELVIVMAIIATLTALATFNFSQARVRARDVQRKSELRAIRDALELYKNDQLNQSYPAGDLSTALATYMPKLPVDPKEKVTDNSWMDYTYNRTDTLTYTLQACLENTSDPDKVVGGACTGGGADVGVLYQLSQP